MAQQVFNQWAPVAKAQNEQGQEVYLPFAGIHAQTRDGKDEIIVGAGNMVWTGSMWVPVSDQNRLPVEAALSGSVLIPTLETAVELGSSDGGTITVEPGQAYSVEVTRQGESHFRLALFAVGGTAEVSYGATRVPGNYGTLSRLFVARAVELKLVEGSSAFISGDEPVFGRAYNVSVRNAHVTNNMEIRQLFVGRRFG